MKIAVIGGNEFVIGFQLAGIRRTIEAKQDPTKQFLEIGDDKELGIIITDDLTINKVNEVDRHYLERSPRPILIVLSKEGSGQENLRKMIMQAIGIDILKEDD